MRNGIPIACEENVPSMCLCMCIMYHVYVIIARKRGIFVMF